MIVSIGKCVFVLYIYNIICFLAMIIGFTERRQTVSEAEASTLSFFEIHVNVTSERLSEIDHLMLYRLISIGTATVLPFETVENAENVDAFFGSIHMEGDHTEQRDLLIAGETESNSLVTMIRNDIKAEDEECFSIRIISVNIIFFCYNDDSNPINSFCEHTICIEDDDGKAI